MDPSCITLPLFFFFYVAPSCIHFASLHSFIVAVWVHRAVTKNGLHIAVKIQYPGVADSIESDIENVKRLLDYTNLIPENLFLDRAMKVAKEELSRECDYELEATNQRRFRDLLSNTKGFYVPKVMTDISSKRVLATELVPGIPIDKVALLTQETRNYVAKKLLELALMELFTDPNWSNFLYDEATRTINLIDFGAARDFPKCFVDDYLRMRRWVVAEEMGHNGEEDRGKGGGWEGDLGGRRQLVVRVVN
ncbi:hypothetical protein TEA_016922 [Camellia sinensis var. sinensis]|uniref:ABC1 atypical kinase-like domain-containing protein n=1 Tax=Camellia sinensis var. sinensis TaxID=542762 RepID=A0A4S4EGD7_CAMSN|nr:hypothetical protein TEA_016922 [Camellia sinensis var. sinensis]